MDTKAVEEYDSDIIVPIIKTKKKLGLFSDIPVDPETAEMYKMGSMNEDVNDLIQNKSKEFQLKTDCPSGHCIEPLKIEKLGRASGYTVHFTVEDANKTKYHVKCLGCAESLRDSSLNEFFILKVLEKLGYGPPVIGHATCFISKKKNFYPMIVTLDLSNNEEKLAQNGTKLKIINEFQTAFDLDVHPNGYSLMKLKGNNTKDLVENMLSSDDTMTVYFLIKFLELGDCIQNNQNFGILFTSDDIRIRVKPIILDFHLVAHGDEYSPLLKDDDDTDESMPETLFDQFVKHSLTLN